MFATWSEVCLGGDHSSLQEEIGVGYYEALRIGKSIPKMSTVVMALSATFMSNCVSLAYQSQRVKREGQSLTLTD